MVSDQLIFQLALTLIPQIGPVQAKLLLEHFDAPAIFRAKRSALEKIEGIGSIRADSIKSFSGFQVAEQELNFIEKYGIQPLFITDPDYPARLLHCYDSPTLLFYRGTADLNASKVLSIIGTRNHSEYGKLVTEKLIRELAAENILVISGLAYGIDAIAHRAAIKNGLPTVGVLAHGLNTVYPFDHKGMAKEMIKQGGLLTEFSSLSKPDKHNFPVRNRIVAGMSDATVVIETGIKGGSMITAELANGYNKDVFAYPGKITDIKSMGCNELIRNNKASLITSASDLVQVLGWEEQTRNKKDKKAQRELFIELSHEERILVNILNEKQDLHIDEINMKSGMSTSSVAGAMLNLELKGVVYSKPGKIYSIRQ